MTVVHSERQRGFTLLEMLIGMALLAIMLAMAFAALRFSSRSIERTDALVRETEELRSAGAVLQRLLSQAQPLQRDDERAQVMFHGEAQVVEFVAPVPVQDGRLAGLYLYRLRFVPAAVGVQLLLEYQPYRPGVPLAWESAPERTVLVRGLRSGGFSYFAPPQDAGAETWSERWTLQDALPVLFRMQLERRPGVAPWPELVVPLHARRRQ